MASWNSGHPWVYLVAWSDGGPVKVGSSKDPQKRVIAIRCVERRKDAAVRATWNFGWWAGEAEALLQLHLASYGNGSDWFRLPVADAIAIADKLFAKLPRELAERIYAGGLADGEHAEAAERFFWALEQIPLPHPTGA